MIIMKTLVYGLVACSIFIFCNNDNSTNFDKGQYYSIKVIGKGLDCGDTYLVEFLEKKDSVAQIISSTNTVSSNTGIYYGDGLKTEYQKDNLTLFIKFREIQSNEINVCTTLGPGYQHIMITEIMKN